ncbi:DNA-binding transcriptional LysR family regulator [Streptacidiphilus sp. BW17]|uniref:LysR family substrate-binding domain-containing protein n=1 Tax=Streptacidiphilus sp. BW17 TaxID=3156274 RepID=UPI0035122F8E
MTDSPATAPFRLAYVPGVTPAKWVRVWNERVPETPIALQLVPAGEGEATLHGGGADAGLVRLPVDKTHLSAIPLYTETTVVVVPKEHELADAEEVSVAELAEVVVLHPLDDVLGWDEGTPGEPAFERPATTADAVDLVSAGIGVLIVPQSLARLHHRRDLTYRPLTDAPQSQIALSWLQDRTTDLVEEFIGIVRGRTVNSSRGRSQAETPATKESKATAAKKKQPKSQPQKQSGRPRSGGGGAAAGGARKQTPRRGKPRR